MNVFLYCRVSTDEQAKFGWSITTQESNLRKYCDAHNYSIKGVFKDEGVSGGTLNRPALNSMLESLKNGKINMILFTKLDRWSRNVAHYYEIQKVLDEYNVVWKAIEEDYETETSSGKFKVNVMLSVNQQFKDATSERIKRVFEYKVMNGYAITGQQPLGYKVDKDKKVIKSEDDGIILMDIFDKFKECKCITETRDYIYNKYHRYKDKGTIKKILIDKAYIGVYKDNPNYYDPYLTLEEHEYICDIVNNRNRKKKVKQDYIFKSMLKCCECGGTLSGTFAPQKNTPTFAYKCTRYANNHTCSKSCYVNEKWLEEYLIDNINEELNNYFKEQEFKTKESTIDISKEISKLEQKKKRISESFINGWIDIDKAKKDISDIESSIIELKKDIKPLNKDIDIIKIKDWKNIYYALDRKNKHIWWSAFIDYIEIDNTNYKTNKECIKIHFL